MASECITEVPATCPIIDSVIKDVHTARRNLRDLMRVRDDNLKSEIDIVYRDLEDIIDNMESIRTHNEKLRALAIEGLSNGN